MTDFDSCFDMRDGNMVLRGIINYSLPNDTAPYLTGGIYTKGKKAFSNGRLEIRAKLNGARGEWPAIWMLPIDAPWPMGGEIDIMERLNHDTIAYQTIHTNYTYNLGIKDNPLSHSLGAINTDNLLHAILDKEKGLLPKGKILTHLAVMQIPTYDKLLFFSDAAVIPRPTLQQRIEMIWYAICTCRRFGIEQPRISLIHCTEKVSAKFLIGSITLDF